MNKVIERPSLLISQQIGINGQGMAPTYCANWHCYGENRLVFLDGLLSLKPELLYQL